jgi:hypothetical protein
MKVNDLVKIPATGRAYKLLTGRVVEINGDQVKIALTGRGYKICTRCAADVKLAGV